MKFQHLDRHGRLIRSRFVSKNGIVDHTVSYERVYTECCEINLNYISSIPEPQRATERTRKWFPAITPYRSENSVSVFREATRFE